MFYIFQKPHLTWQLQLIAGDGKRSHRRGDDSRRGVLEPRAFQLRHAEHCSEDPRVDSGDAEASTDTTARGDLQSPQEDGRMLSPLLKIEGQYCLQTHV